MAEGFASYLKSAQRPFTLNLLVSHDMDAETVEPPESIAQSTPRQLHLEGQIASLQVELGRMQRQLHGQRRQMEEMRQMACDRPAGGQQTARRRRPSLFPFRCCREGAWGLALGGVEPIATGTQEAAAQVPGYQPRTLRRLSPQPVAAPPRSAGARQDWRGSSGRAAGGGGQGGAGGGWPPVPYR